MKDEGGKGWELLQQTKLFRPFDGLVAAVGIELAVDVFDVGFDCIYRDHEFFGNLWAGEVCAEQTKDVEFAVAERVNKRLIDQRMKDEG